MDKLTRILVAVLFGRNPHHVYNDWVIWKDGMMYNALDSTKREFYRSSHLRMLTDYIRKIDEQ